jgi:hypothetical protein
VRDLAVAFILVVCVAPAGLGTGCSSSNGGAAGSGGDGQRGGSGGTSGGAGGIAGGLGGSGGAGGIAGSGGAVCAPQQTRCDAAGTNGVQTCDSNGQWGAPVDCTNKTCANGACQGVCAPQQKQCDAAGTNGVQTCSSNGQWGTAVTCPTGLCVSGVCQTPVMLASGQSSRRNERLLDDELERHRDEATCQVSVGDARRVPSSRSV